MTYIPSVPSVREALERDRQAFEAEFQAQYAYRPGRSQDGGYLSVVARNHWFYYQLKYSGHDAEDDVTTY